MVLYFVEIVTAGEQPLRFSIITLLFNHGLTQGCLGNTTGKLTSNNVTSFGLLDNLEIDTCAYGHMRAPQHFGFAAFA